MEFPKRTASHIAETDSWKIFRDRTPSEWIPRELTERDYGIDAYIEIPRANGDLVGHLMSIQLKGTKAIKWLEGSSSKRAIFSGIVTSKINYWMALPIPVFLVVCDINTRRAYFAAVKTQVRQRYREYLKQSSFGFELYENAEFGSVSGRALFIADYIRERTFERFETAMLTVQSHWASYLKFMDRNAHLDAAGGVENDDEALFVQLYKIIVFLGDWLGLKLSLPSLEQIYKEDRNVFQSQWYHLHHWSFNNLMPDLRRSFIEVMIQVKRILTEQEPDYWSKIEPVLYRVALNLEIDDWSNRKQY